MKTVGFSSVKVMLLVLSESVLITGIGGAIGLTLSLAAVAAIGSSMQQLLPFSGVPTSSYGPAIGLIVVLGLLAGTLPCLQAFQLRITEALRRG
jgi:putative ABC transport system permease protein